MMTLKQLQDNLFYIMSQSELHIEAIYYVMKDTMRAVEESYNNYLNEQARIAAEEQIKQQEAEAKEQKPLEENKEKERKEE